MNESSFVHVIMHVRLFELPELPHTLVYHMIQNNPKYDCQHQAIEMNEGYPQIARSIRLFQRMDDTNTMLPTSYSLKGSLLPITSSGQLSEGKPGTVLPIAMA
jgi:hypothetical protein